MSLEHVMIYAKPARVLKNACWSCGKSDTYCDGLVEQRDEFCCRECFRAEHDTHTGE